MRAKGKSKNLVRSAWQRVCALLIVLVMLVACNAISMFVRTIGWTHMIADFAQTGTIEEAIEMTFNGENPCSICELSDALSVSESPEKTAELVTPLPTIDFRLMESPRDPLTLAHKRSGSISIPRLSSPAPDRPRPETRPG